MRAVSSPVFTAMRRTPLGRAARPARAAAVDDAAVDEDVHTVGLQVVEQALVVGDQHDAEGGPIGAHLLHAAGDDLQGVDVEPGVGLVEDRQLGLEDRHLQDLVALLLAAGEALVEVAVGERRIHLQALHPVHDRQAQLEHRQVDALAGGERLAQELDHRDAGDLLRVLERQEHAGLGPYVGGPVGDVVALEEDAPGRDLVLRVGQQRVGEGRLARAVRAHERVHLAGLDSEVDASEDVAARASRRVVVGGRPDVQILDPQQLRTGGRGHIASLITTMAIGENRS